MLAWICKMKRKNMQKNVKIFNVHLFQWFGNCGSVEPQLLFQNYEIKLHRLPISR